MTIQGMNYNEVGATECVIFELRQDINDRNPNLNGKLNNHLIVQGSP